MKFCLLPEKHLLLIEGPEAEKFLQGQTTTDIPKMTSDTAHLGAHCNPKGRMVSDFLAVKTGAHSFLLRCHASTAEQLTHSLKKYIVFSKASLTSSPLNVVGFIGDNLAALFTEQGINLPTPFSASVSAKGVFIRLTDTLVEAWLTAEQLQQFKPGTTLEATSTEAWQLGLIQAGMGEVREATVGEWIPQMLNLQLPELAGISFTKGCYTGQEIVARMQYRGKLKRHMRHLSCPQPLPTGEKLFSSASEQSIGEVVISAATASGVAECLAVITDEAFLSGEIFAKIPDKSCLEGLSLPYDIPSPE